MLHLIDKAPPPSPSFDLAPTGALCYKRAGGKARRHPVLISLPQERCATINAGLSAVVQAVLISLPQERCATGSAVAGAKHCAF